MLSNHSSPAVHYWAGRYRESAWLMGPRGYLKAKLRNWIPYALDNDIYACWSQGQEWNADDYFRVMDMVKMEGHKPMWCTVPDAMEDRDETLRRWDKYSDRISAYGWPMAIVAQDGMSVKDLPCEASVVFVGFSSKWKWR